MSGAFYGSLAASASVFVAILTALLVNNYVRIKSDRRQTKNELNRIEEDLDGLEERREDHQEAVNNLVEKREADYKEKAEDQVDEFIESEVPSEFFKPIEHLTVDELYQELIDFHDCESPDDLEDSPTNHHHRDILEERLDGIENQILTDLIPSFASEYEGKGWDLKSEPNRTSLAEAIEEIQDEEDQESENEDENQTEEDDEPDIKVKAENLRRSPLELDEFIDKYREEYSLDDLEDKTVTALKDEYEKTVNKPPESNYSSINSSLGQNTVNSLLSGISPAAMAAAQESYENPLREIDYSTMNKNWGLSIREKQKLEKVQEKLHEVKNEIQILEKRKERLQREKNRLHPEDLNSTLHANIATILLSVVVPMAAYLDTVTEFTISELGWVNIWMIAGSWLFGLIIVFAAIYRRINSDD
ncbi:hypothetical protein HTG_19080 [Natrinema mahii]|nr:hypothetical protein HTG_19080 [Natrinema mahii]